MKLLKNIIRKFIDTISIDNYEVETDTGWEDVSEINKTIKYDLWEIRTESGKKLKAADDHIVFDTDYNEVFIKDLKINDYILTDVGAEKITHIKNHNVKKNMFDLAVNSANQRYYSNGILSHNSSTLAMFMTWYTIFHNDKSFGVVANKEMTAKEIFSKVIKTIEYIPQFLKPGIVEINKTSIQFDNNSRVIAAATSEYGISGWTLNCLVCDEVALINARLWKSFYTAMEPVLSADPNGKLILISTPKGLNHWYHIWNNAKRGKSSFVPFTAAWNDIPGRDNDFREKVINDNGIEAWKQEYECVTGDTKITIKNKKTNEIKNIKIQDLFSDIYT